MPGFFVLCFHFSWLGEILRQEKRARTRFGYRLRSGLHPADEDLSVGTPSLRQQGAVLRTDLFIPGLKPGASTKPRVARQKVNTSCDLKVWESGPFGFAQTGRGATQSPPPLKPEPGLNGPPSGRG
jgi:hypothetical protein